MNYSKEEIIVVLKEVQDPELKRDIVSLGMVKEVAVEGESVYVYLVLTTSNEGVKENIKSQIQKKVGAFKGIKHVTVQMSKATGRGPAFSPKLALENVQHVIAVSSGKGGVGKTTTSVNLAYALAKLGQKVGLLDGDIYGPNVPLMVGVSHDERPTMTQNEKMIPLDAKGIKMISMGVLIPPDQPMIWRGPMLHSAVTQLLQKVEWGELDFLVVDLPPGTGDVQLSLAQTVPLSGALMVTTPQEVSLLDVRKGIAMFQKTHVPILGIIENMTGEIFGKGGGKKMAEQFQVPYLGEIPLDAKIRKGGDAGTPIVLSDPNSEAAKSFLIAAGSLIEMMQHMEAKA